ncbi:PTB domain-containing engulfment adapter protein 1-like isoform X4 [Clavelina lepadiformis]|uniref:PTB domain-containing engulfment adapter protein 1-like isoform X4 n=1 Tax=Clavelina lepadiformis TaxID=159417 RepID=UPI004042F3D0
MVLSPNKERWIHSPDALINGKVTYNVKFLGVTEVDDPRGMDVVQTALQKLKFSQQIKRSEGEKPPKVELNINIDTIKITNQRTKEVLHDIPLNHVSFCADDKQDKRLFSFITKGKDEKHYCYGLDSLHQANDITLSIGQAFSLAFEKIGKQPSSSTQQINELNKRVQMLEKENSDLKQRLSQLEGPGKKGRSQSLSAKHPPVFAKDAFDMQPFGSTVVKLPSPEEVFPTKTSPRTRTLVKREVDFSQTLFDSISEQRNGPRATQPMVPEGFSQGVAMKEAELSLDAFDPLKNN